MKLQIYIVLHRKSAFSLVSVYLDFLHHFYDIEINDVYKENNVYKTN